MEKVFRTRFETANRVYRYFRTGPYNFPILLGFDALRLRISSQGISCTNIQLLEMLNEIFTFEIFEFSTDDPSVDHRWLPVGKPPPKLISPHRWSPMDFPGLSVRVLFFDSQNYEQARTIVDSWESSSVIGHKLSSDRSG